MHSLAARKTHHLNSAKSCRGTPSGESSVRVVDDSPRRFLVPVRELVGRAILARNLKTALGTEPQEFGTSLPPRHALRLERQHIGSLLQVYCNGLATVQLPAKHHRSDWASYIIIDCSDKRPSAMRVGLASQHQEPARRIAKGQLDSGTSQGSSLAGIMKTAPCGFSSAKSSAFLISF